MWRNFNLNVFGSLLAAHRSRTHIRGFYALILWAKGLGGKKGATQWAGAG